MKVRELIKHLNELADDDDEVFISHAEWELKRIKIDPHKESVILQ